MRARLRVGLMAAVLALSATASTHAFADDTPERKKQAEGLANSAFSLMQQGLYAEASELFRKADERYHSPVFILFMAEAEEKQKHLVKARKLLKSVVDEPMNAKSPEAFIKAREKAEKRIEALDARIPTITISLAGSGAELAKVTLNGKSARVESPIQVDPGSHEAKASLDGATVDESIKVEEGQKVRVELRLAGKADPPPPEPDDGKGPNMLLPGIAFGVGGAGLLMGAVAGGVFVGRADELKAQCPDNQCPESLREEGDEVTTLGNISTAGFVIGGIGVAAGAVLLAVELTSGDDGDEAKAWNRKGLPRTGVQDVKLHLGPSHVGLSGRF